MQVFVGLDQIPKKLKNPVLTIGNFDGVHRGHQSLFQKVREWAVRLNGQSVVMTFQPHPLEVLFPGKGPAFITQHERKLQLIESCGIDCAIIIPFNREFSLISAHSFVKDLLVDKIGIRAIVVGYDYRFGHSREGDIDFLREMGKQHGFEVDTVAGIRIDEKVVSSTAIRKLIHDGDLKEAAKLLGRCYEVTGTVITGRSRGRLLGFPTANVRIPIQATPRTGVYAVETEVDGRCYGGAASLGFNPTFGDGEFSLEVHILGFNEDIYGKQITIRFLDRLRDEKRFSGPEELVAQIKKDVQLAGEIFSETRTGKCPKASAC